MIRKELKVKYKNSVLGFAWSLLNPLLYLVVFYVVFEMILGSRHPRVPDLPAVGPARLEPLLDRARRARRGSVVGNAGS